MNQCKHPRVQVVSRDEDTEYVECLECREVFESSEFKDMAIEERIQSEEAGTAPPTASRTVKVRPEEKSARCRDGGNCFGRFLRCFGNEPSASFITKHSALL